MRLSPQEGSVMSIIIRGLINAVTEKNVLIRKRGEDNDYPTIVIPLASFMGEIPAAHSGIVLEVPESAEVDATNPDYLKVSEVSILECAQGAGASNIRHAADVFGS